MLAASELRKLLRTEIIEEEPPLCHLASSEDQIFEAGTLLRSVSNGRELYQVFGHIRDEKVEER